MGKHPDDKTQSDLEECVHDEDDEEKKKLQRIKMKV